MSELETLDDGRMRMAATADGVPVTLHLDDSLRPPQAGVEKLRAIAAVPGLTDHVDVLPDVHFKAKNFIPTGVCLRVAGQVAPMLVGPPNDSMVLATLEADRSELTDGDLDAIFNGLMKRIAMFRRDMPIETEETLSDILRFGAPAVAEAWGFGGDDLARMDYGGRYFQPGEEPTFAEILAAFPSKDDPRPPRVPGFVPWHDLMSAAGHTLGVLDGGGHFMELSHVSRVDWPEAAKGYELREGQLTIAAHVGPADVGIIAHRQFLPENAETGEIGFLDPKSEEGRRFIVAMGAAANFAYANRLFILRSVREVMDRVLGRPCGLRVLSDAPHDMVERLPGVEADPVYVHRKGVVRGLAGDMFPEDHPFAEHGRPFFFPTCLGEDSLIMTRAAPSEDAFDVCSHGLGRSMTREEAMQAFTEDDVLASVAARGVRIYRYGHEGFSAQAPGAHKDADKIVAMLRRFGLAEPVAVLRPLASLKG